MIVAHWNNPIVSSELRGIVRVGLRGDWPNCTPYFTVDGREATVREVVARLKLVPVIDWIFNKGIPPSWSRENVAKLRSIVVAVYKALGGLRGLSKAKRATIMHVLDAENFTQAIDKTKPRLDVAQGTHHNATFSYLFGEALRATGFTGPAANYAMAHGPECPAVGGGYNRATPFHCPGAMDGATTFLSGYTEADANDPSDYLLPEEVIDAIQKRPGAPSYSQPAPDVSVRWRFGGAPKCFLALSEYQPSLDRIIECAVDYDVDVLLIWTDEAKRKADPAWARSQDKAIINTLRGAGWSGN